MYKIPYKHRERFYNYKTRISENEQKLEKSFKTLKVISILAIVLISLPILEIYDYLNLNLILRKIFDISLLIVFGIPIQYLQIRGNQKELDISRRDFEYLFHTQVEKTTFEEISFTFDDEERVPWEQLERIELFKQRYQGSVVDIFLDPKEKSFFYKVSGDFSIELYGQNEREIRFEATKELIKKDLEALIKYFKACKLDDVIPQLVENKILEIGNIKKWVYDDQIETFTKSSSEKDDQYNGSILIFKDTENTERRWVYLQRHENNLWRVHEDNSGPIGKTYFGREDNEWWIDIENRNLLSFFSVIAEYSFNPQGKILSLVELKKVLQERNIPFVSGTW